MRAAVCRTGYLAAIAEGQHGQDLGGSDAGEPEEAQCSYARELIAERLAERVPHRQQHQPQPMPPESSEDTG